MYQQHPYQRPPHHRGSYHRPQGMPPEVRNRIILLIVGIAGCVVLVVGMLVALIATSYLTQAPKQVAESDRSSSQSSSWGDGNSWGGGNSSVGQPGGYDSSGQNYNNSPNTSNFSGLPYPPQANGNSAYGAGPPSQYRMDPTIGVNEGTTYRGQGSAPPVPTGHYEGRRDGTGVYHPGSQPYPGSQPNPGPGRPAGDALTDREKIQRMSDGLDRVLVNSSQNRYEYVKSRPEFDSHTQFQRRKFEHLVEMGLTGTQGAPLKASKENWSYFCTGAAITNDPTYDSVDDCFEVYLEIVPGDTDQTYTTFTISRPLMPGKALDTSVSSLLVKAFPEFEVAMQKAWSDSHAKLLRQFELVSGNDSIEIEAAADFISIQIPDVEGTFYIAHHVTSRYQHYTSIDDTIRTKSRWCILYVLPGKQFIRLPFW